MTDTTQSDAKKPSIEELLAKIECEELDKLRSVYPELNFRQVLTEKH